MNYILVKTNKIYEELYDLMEEKELSMNNPDHFEMVKFHMENYIGKIKYIKTSENFEMPEDRINNIMECFSSEDVEHMQGNTLLLYSDEEYMYEVLFLENRKDQSDDNINDFASITNIELHPIYGDCAIIKTGMNGKTLVNETIVRKDLFKIIYNNFFHTGIMVNNNEDIKELTFSGDMPSTIIGNIFGDYEMHEIFGLQFVIYKEANSHKLKNELVSKLCKKDIFGRVFVCLLTPIFFKKMCNNKVSIMNTIVSLLENNEKTIIIQKELDDDRIKNPFVIISKYK
jgi:hypothetical protein